jgi:hypothetical protein
MQPRSLSSLDGLGDLGLRGSVDMRPTLLRILTDLYVQKLRHSPEEERHYTELALRLLESVDMPTRAAVATRLARHLSPPPRVMQRLAADLPEIAAAVRRHPLLQSAHSPAPVEPGVPASHQDTGNHPTLPGEPDPIVDAGTARELTDLFFAAPAVERRLILRNLHIVAPLPTGSVLVARDPAVGLQLEAAALGRRREEFARQLARALHIPPELARWIVNDELGEPLVVGARALAVSADVLYRMLMFVNPVVGHSATRVHALATLYEEITPPSAEGIVAIWQALPRNGSAAKYQPVNWDDETPGRARPSMALQRSAAVPRTSERRTAS